MKQLEKEFTFNGFTFRQVRRKGMLAIYEQHKHGRIAWEVIRIQSHDGRTFGEKWYPASEFYPSANTWGRLGWTCKSSEEAHQRFESLSGVAEFELEDA